MTEDAFSEMKLVAVPVSCELNCSPLKLIIAVGLEAFHTNVVTVPVPTARVEAPPPPEGTAPPSMIDMLEEYTAKCPTTGADCVEITT